MSNSIYFEYIILNIYSNSKVFENHILYKEYLNYFILNLFV